MQKTVYSCNQCNKTFGDVKHISLTFGPHSGIAFPPDPKSKAGGNSYWHVRRNLQSQFLHFCNGTCIGRYFAALMKNQNEKQNHA